MDLAMALDLLSWACLIGGSFFCVVGGIGILRFPDFYTRMHASGVTDTLGAGLMLIGLMFQAGHYDNPISNIAKLILILLFLTLTSATSTHALAKSALNNGPKPLLKEDLRGASKDD